MNQRTRLPMVVVVASTLQACGYEDWDDREVEQTTTALTAVTMTPDGTLESTAEGGYGAVTSRMILDAAKGSGWATGQPDRFVIVDYADWRNAQRQDPSPCGDTEHVRWLYRTTGSRNIRYCESAAFGVCLRYRRLSEASTASHMIELFSANRGWLSREAIHGATLAPGDYLAVADGEDRRPKSAVVMAVSADRRWVFTSEGDGTDGECVAFRRRDYVVDGTLHLDVVGAGKIDVTF